MPAVSDEDHESITLCGPLADWFLTLSSGEHVTLWADSYSGEADDSDEYVFRALAEGSPPRLIEIARFPKSAIARISSVSW